MKRCKGCKDCKSVCWCAVGGIVFVIVLIAAASFFLFRYFQSSKVSSPSKENTTFRSSNVMDFTIEVPKGFEVEEKFAVTTIKNSQGEIIITTSGTEYNSLEDVINNLNRKSAKIDYITINTQKAAIENSDTRKAYYFYFNNSIYSINTSLPSLFSVLDQIAQSFQYTPD